MLRDCHDNNYFVSDIIYNDIVYNILVKYGYSPRNPSNFKLNNGYLYVNIVSKTFYMAYGPPHGKLISLKKFLDILKGQNVCKKR